MAVTNTGLGATIVFSGGISLTGRWKSVSEIPAEVEILDDTALDTVNYHRSVPDDLQNLDTFEIECYFDGKKTIPIKSVGTILLTLPTQEGQAGPAILTGTCFIVRGLLAPALAAGSRLMQTLRVKFDGRTGPTWTPAQ